MQDIAPLEPTVGKRRPEAGSTNYRNSCLAAPQLRFGMNGYLGSDELLGSCRDGVYGYSVNCRSTVGPRLHAAAVEMTAMHTQVPMPLNDWQGWGHCRKTPKESTVTSETLNAQL